MRQHALFAQYFVGQSSTSTNHAESAHHAAKVLGGWYRFFVISKKVVGTEADLAKLLDLCDNIMGRSFCALGDGATSPITSSIKYFRDEYIAHLDKWRMPI